MAKDALTVLVLRMREGAELPLYGTSLSAGADLCACLDKDLVLQPGCYEKIPTGLSIQIPQGFEGQVRPRSGLAAKFGITVLNSPGTIDADYRGEVAVLLINLGKESVVVRHKDRIAQLVIAPCVQASFAETSSQLEATERGSGGFGSTGV